MTKVLNLNGIQLNEESIYKTVIELDIPIKASGGWTNISQMNDIPEGVYAYTFAGVYDTSKSWQEWTHYGGILYWYPTDIVCNANETSSAFRMYVSHATNSEALQFGVYMPSGGNDRPHFRIYTPFTNSVTQTGKMRLRKLL